MNDDILALASVSVISMFIGLVLTAAGHPNSGVTVAFMGLIPLGFVGLIAFGMKADELLGVEDAWAYETAGSANSDNTSCKTRE